MYRQLYPNTTFFCYSSVAHTSTPSVNLALGSKSGFTNKCRARAGKRACDFGLRRGSGLKIRPFYEGRNQGSKGAQFPGGESLWRRRMTAWSAGKSQQVTSTFINTVHFLAKDLRLEHGGAKHASCPGRHLTLLRPCRSQLSVGTYAGANKGRWKGYILHPSNSKYKLTSFSEIGYSNFRPNVSGACKRISMEILIGVGLHK